MAAHPEPLPVLGVGFRAAPAFGRGMGKGNPDVPGCLSSAGRGCALCEGRVPGLCCGTALSGAGGCLGAWGMAWGSRGSSTSVLGCRDLCPCGSVLGGWMGAVLRPSPEQLASRGQE